MGAKDCREQAGRRGEETEPGSGLICMASYQDARGDLYPLETLETLLRAWRLILGTMLAASALCVLYWLVVPEPPEAHVARATLSLTPPNLRAGREPMLVAPTMAHYRHFFTAKGVNVFIGGDGTILNVSAVRADPALARKSVDETVEAGLNRIVRLEMQFLQEQIKVIKARLEAGGRSFSEMRNLDLATLAGLETRRAVLENHLIQGRFLQPLLVVEATSVSKRPRVLRKAAAVVGILALALLVSCAAVMTRAALAKRRVRRDSSAGA